METIIKHKQDSITNVLATTHTSSSSGDVRTITNCISVVTGSANMYDKQEIDSIVAVINESIEDNAEKRTTFTAAQGQTLFDMGQEITGIHNVTRNGIDINPNIFTINSPYLQYTENMNGGSIIQTGDIIIINYI